jgi:hypothetical protein
MNWIPIVDSGVMLTDAQQIECEKWQGGKVLAVEFQNAGNTQLIIKYGGIRRNLAPGATFGINCNTPCTYIVTTFDLSFLPPTVGSANNLCFLSIQSALE